MLDHDLITYILGTTVVVSPTILIFVLGVPTLLGYPLSERLAGKAVQISIVVGLLASLTILGMMIAVGTRHVPIYLGSWVHISEPTKEPAKTEGEKTEPGKTEGATHAAEYHFSVKFVFDRLSVPFVILSFVLCGTIGAFANKYMHRERGFNRFFVLYSFFVLGMVVTSLAGTIETLFTGWELVGLSSAMLVAFYHERPAPVRNGLRVWAVYRVSDAALLVASVMLHHLYGGGDFDKLLGSAAASAGQAGEVIGAAQKVLMWPDGNCLLTPQQSLVIGLLFLLAAAGKSALVPFSGWLPRAMEGPTPSSAVFYGALSVHLGAFLLLRVSPILEQSLTLRIIVMALGIATALFAAVAGRVQTDIKSALSFASLTQVGIIVVEIGTGLRWLQYVALIHILGHACLRTLQFIRAPTLLYDYKLMENAIGAGLPQQASVWDRLIPTGLRVWLYQAALERGFLDTYLTDFLVAPFLWFFRWCDSMERSWISLLSGEAAPDPEPVESTPSTVDELL
jgi:NAD(P)H-quinone oxidoreductase subunit 5